MRGLAGEVGQGESFSCSPPSRSGQEPWHPLPRMAARGQHENKKSRPPPPPRTQVQVWERWAGSTRRGQGALCGEHWAQAGLQGAPCGEHQAGALGGSTRRGALCGEHCAGRTGPGRGCGEHQAGEPGGEHCAGSTGCGRGCGEHRAGRTRQEHQAGSTEHGQGCGEGRSDGRRRRPPQAMGSSSLLIAPRQCKHSFQNFK